MIRTPNLHSRRRDYYYNPPQNVIDAGVVKRKSFQIVELMEAIKYAEEGNKLIAEWREERDRIDSLKATGRVKDIIYAYMHSNDFTSLSAASKRTYTEAIEAWRSVRIAGAELQYHKVESLETPTIQRMYEKQIQSGSVHSANYSVAVYRAMFNFAIRCGYAKYNPFEKIQKKQVANRKKMWDRSEVRAFLNTAFSKWEWRNIGIVFYMIYEWGQRVSDILTLKWDSVDLENNIVTIKQSKRGAIVRLPISASLAKMLAQQKKDFFLSDYVVPQMVRRHGKFVPYTLSTINKKVDEIMKAARIDTTLQLRDLRRTAITETIENGGDLLTVMQMSGHQNSASVTPYFVHTLKGATKAQQIRNFPDALVGSVNLLNRGQDGSAKSRTGSIGIS